ncbi:AraC family transcriptional regulator [Paenibacillus oryzisoli]|uniref:AraC family transcriptional regulator n=1 Tax=Paenibacillus oryzisoli TaxID=1850517 RepID=UPI003D2CF735
MKRHRWTYNVVHQGAVEAVPELLLVGFDEIHSALHLGYHEHEGYEFVYIEKGKASWELDSHIYETRAGDVFHTRPGEIHRGGFNVIEPSRFWWFMLTPPAGENWMCLPAAEVAALRLMLEHLPRIVQIGVQPVSALQRLQRALMSTSALQQTLIRQALLEVLLHIVQPIQPAEAISADLLRQFDALIHRSAEDPVWRPSVEEMAEIAHISPSHFMRTFRQYTGFSPMAYLERQRIKYACELLSGTKHSVLAISTALGYASSQHFATAFKRVTGKSPLGWRKSAD